MSKADIAALLERVRAATGPDRAIDGSLALLSLHLPDGTYAYSSLGGYVVSTSPKVPVGPGIGQFHPADYYTASLDAIVALIDRELPGAAFTLNCFDVQRKPARVRYNRAHLSDYPGADHGALGEGATPALALCAAFLATKLSDHSQT